jgi:hypothetical protein
MTCYYSSRTHWFSARLPSVKVGLFIIFHVILNIFLHEYYRTVIQSTLKKDYRRKNIGTENDKFYQVCIILKTGLYGFGTFFFLILVCEAIGSASTPGLLCQPRVIVKMIVEKQMECRLAWGNRSSGRKPPPAPLLSITKSHMTRPGFEPGPPRWEAGH